MNKKILIVLLTITAGSMLQARHTDADGVEHRGLFENVLESPFEVAALPFDEGYYSDRHRQENDKIRAKNSKKRNRSDRDRSDENNMKRKDSDKKSKRSRTRPTEERS